MKVSTECDRKHQAKTMLISTGHQYNTAMALVYVCGLLAIKDQVINLSMLISK